MNFNQWHHQHQCYKDGARKVGDQTLPQSLFLRFFSKEIQDGRRKVKVQCKASTLLYEARTKPEHSQSDENSLCANFYNINGNCGFAHM